jgi:glyoxalase superfamily protein
VITWLTAFLDLPSESFDPGVAFWCDVTGYRLSRRRGPDGAFATLVPPAGDAYLRVQDVGSAQMRVHLDLHTPTVDALVERARSLGAVDLPADDVAVLRSPGGFVFCVVSDEGLSAVPPPASWPDGLRSRVDQVCLDIPAQLHSAELAFWRALTEWRWTDGDAPEFSRLDSPTAVRLLLQRLDSSEPAVTAHLDLSSTSTEAEVARHISLGARLEYEGSGWFTMTDPTGRTYCVTRRSP